MLLQMASFHFFLWLSNILLYMYVVHLYLFIMGFPGDLDGKESACNAGDLGSIPGLGRSPGEGNGYPLQYSCLENSKDRGVWKAIVTWVTKELDRTEQLTLTYSCIDGHLFLIFLSASFMSILQSIYSWCPINCKFLKWHKYFVFNFISCRESKCSLITNISRRPWMRPESMNHMVSLSLWKSPGASSLRDVSFHGASIRLDDLLAKLMNLKIIFSSQSSLHCCFYFFIQEYTHHKRYRNNKLNRTKPTKIKQTTKIRQNNSSKKTTTKEPKWND